MAIATLASLVLVTCSKEAATPPVADLDDPNIVLHDFEPDTMFAVQGSASGTFPMDLDGDSMVDISVGLYHSYYQNGPHLYDQYAVQITGSDSLTFLVTPYSGAGPCNGPLPLNALIDSSYSFVGWLRLYTSSIFGGNCGPYVQHSLIGFETIVNGTTHYGWMRLKALPRTVWIDAYAIHSTSGHWIRAGDN